MPEDYSFDGKTVSSDDFISNMRIDVAGHQINGKVYLLPAEQDSRGTHWRGIMVVDEELSNEQVQDLVARSSRPEMSGDFPLDIQQRIRETGNMPPIVSERSYDAERKIITVRITLEVHP
jgi:hypothetical protein